MGIDCHSQRYSTAEIAKSIPKLLGQRNPLYVLQLVKYVAIWSDIEG